MRHVAICTAALLSVVAFSGSAEAGCLKGAAVGGIAGHFAGHGLAGAAVGCAVGSARSKSRNVDNSGYRNGDRERGTLNDTNRGRSY